MHIPNEIETRLKKHFDVALIEGISRETGKLLEAAELCKIQGVAGMLDHYSGLSDSLDYLQSPHFKDKFWVIPEDARRAIHDLWKYIDKEIADRLQEHCGCRFGPHASK